MKCPKCDGRGAVQIAPNVKGLKRCPVCDGSGEVSQILQTTEEWFDGLSTKEKAEALENITRSVLVQRPPMCHDVCNREFWETWLKQPHR